MSDKTYQFIRMLLEQKKVTKEELSTFYKVRKKESRVILNILNIKLIKIFDLFGKINSLLYFCGNKKKNYVKFIKSKEHQIYGGDNENADFLLFLENTSVLSEVMSNRIVSIRFGYYHKF